MSRQQMSPKPAAGIDLLCATLFRALNAVIARGIVNGMPPLALSFWRWILVLVILLPISWRHLRNDWPEVKRSLGWLMALVVLSVST